MGNVYVAKCFPNLVSVASATFFQIIFLYAGYFGFIITNLTLMHLYKVIYYLCSRGLTLLCWLRLHRLSLTSDLQPSWKWAVFFTGHKQDITAMIEKHLNIMFTTVHYCGHKNRQPKCNRETVWVSTICSENTAAVKQRPHIMMFQTETSILSNTTLYRADGSITPTVLKQQNSYTEKKNV